MKLLVIVLFTYCLPCQVVFPQFVNTTGETPGGESATNSTDFRNNPDYLFGYRTLYLTVGSTLYGRFLNVGVLINRYSVEVEGAVQVKKIRLGTRDSVGHFTNPSVKNALNLGVPDSNVSLNIATLRTFRREKFKLLGALLELDAGINIKSWIYKEDNLTVDSFTVHSLGSSAGANQSGQVAYLFDSRMEFSSGPSLKFRISSGKEKGEAVFNIIGGIDLNCYFSRKEPSIDVAIGIMFAPFSY